MEATKLHNKREGLTRNQQALLDQSLGTNNHASSDFILITNSHYVLEAYQRMVNPHSKPIRQ